MFAVNSRLCAQQPTRRKLCPHLSTRSAHRPYRLTIPLLLPLPRLDPRFPTSPAFVHHARLRLSSCPAPVLLARERQALRRPRRIGITTVRIRRTRDQVLVSSLPMNLRTDSRNNLGTSENTAMATMQNPVDSSLMLDEHQVLATVCVQLERHRRRMSRLVSEVY